LVYLNVSVRWGLRRTAFQILPTVDLDNPECLAIEVRDQWVASVSGQFLGCLLPCGHYDVFNLSSVIFLGAPHQ
jgi:hypothetical protein